MIQDLLSKRFATKKFNPTKKVSENDLLDILEAARLSCSSVNTQPWHITILTNAELREKLTPVSYNQAQIKDASHILILSVVKDPKARIQQTADLIHQQSGEAASQAFLKMALGWLPESFEAQFAWLKPQVYIALANMMLAAIEKGIDSCPMEGFDPKAYAEILGLTEAQPAVLLAIGYAMDSGHPKVRVPLQDMIKRLE